MNQNSDLLGQAILDYHHGQRGFQVLTKINGIPDQSMDPAIFFKTSRQLKAYEKMALKRSSGRILDIGAGAGTHSLWLQEKGHEVVAVEKSALAAKVCADRGVRDTRCLDIMDLHNEKFDTILLLMNGLGITGNIESTKSLFLHLKTLLRSGGVIIGDSSDIFYHVKDTRKAALKGKYYGEVVFELTYKGEIAKPLNWVYLDPITLEKISLECGLSCDILLYNDNDHYLAGLRHI